MIVIDVGCATHGSDESIERLVEMYEPSVLYGFDPACETHSKWTTIGNTLVIVSPEVAWTYNGKIGFVVSGLGGHVSDAGQEFGCIDLAGFIHMKKGDDEIVLKMDAEGSEYTVLHHLVEHDADLALKLALVEWHCEVCGIGGNGRHREGCTVDRDWWLERREAVEGSMRCEMGEWNL